jgi:4-amino-4-deoxy-L-arabinose transferase-like glycosyltransferase
MSLAGGFADSGSPVPGVQQTRGERDIAYLLACVVLAAFAFAFNWATGHRGVFLLDQSLNFDGGWRILQGQTPYKDFIFPWGPVVFFIQALFFRIFGVCWSATVLPACLFNTLATLSVIRIARLLGGGSRVLALCAGLATAVCFQPPFGTLNFEQTAMFFDLLALQAVVESLRASGYRRSLWQLAGGVSLAIAVFSKQNFGVFFVPVVVAVLVAGDLPDVRRTCRSVFFAGIGLAAGLTIFLGWVWVYSDFSSFVQCSLVLASEIGRSRVSWKLIAKALSFNVVPNLWEVDLIGFFSGGIALPLACFNFRRPLWRETAPACVVALLLPLFHSLTQAVTAQEFQNNFAFVGLAACLGVSLLSRLVGNLPNAPAADPGPGVRFPSARALRIGIFAVAGIWGAAVMTYEVRSAWTRMVQEFTARTVFRDPIHVRGLERVRWGEPQLIQEIVLRRVDFEDLVSYLSARRSNFFVMGDSSLLYGLLGVRPPQPLLYFMPGHSFLERQIPRLDQMISASLERNRIDLVVREKVMAEGMQVRDPYALFPRTWAWFTGHFDHVRDFGNYEIWERRHDGSQ